MKALILPRHEVAYYLNILYVVPLFYIAAARLNTSTLYAIKDVLFLVIFLFLLRHTFSNRLFLMAAGFIVLCLYSSFRSFENPGLYLLSLREFLFYPLFGMLLGYRCTQLRIDDAVFRVSIVFLLFTISYLVVFPNDSFGSTSRLKSFWDREHEPAIVAGITTLGAVFFLRWRSFIKVPLILISILVILLSGSRSILLGVGASLLVVALWQGSFKFILVLFIVALVIFFNFEQLTLSGRSLDHNLLARTEQYQLALDSIVNTDFLGIGADKYGAVSGLAHVEYCVGNRCTSTMDSSLIKYVVNYGFIFVLFFVIWCLQILCLMLRNESNASKFAVSVFVFSLTVGAVTGKLGAFPLNLLFYMNMGVVLGMLRVNRTCSRSSHSAR